MSSNAYTLKIAIDDSKIKDLEKRLMAIVGGQALGGANPLIPQGGGQGDKSGMMKNIAKLSLIATAVTGIVMMVQKLVSMTITASPMLQQMLKLFNFGIMLILRPIGDFFGFFLRPLIIYFIRSVALPFYRQWRPIMQQLGNFLGMQLTDNFAEAGAAGGKAIWEEGFNHEEGMKNLKSNLLAWGALFNVIDGNEDSFENMKLFLNDVETNFGKINDFFTGFGTGFDGLLTTATTNFTAWGTTFSTWLTAFNPGAYLVSQVVSWIAKLNLPNWDDITKKFTEFQTALGGIFDSIRDAIVALIEKLTLGLIDLNGNNDGGNTNTQNNYIDINGNGKDDLEDVGNWLSDWLKGDK